MKLTKATCIAAAMLITPTVSLAAQSVSTWDCGTDGYRIGMNENVSSGASISVAIDGASAVSASRASDIATMVELDGSYTCPPNSSLSVTIDSSSYSATVD